jgi:ubiquinone/menaquinone biosynthesis C-methylase UbiE
MAAPSDETIKETWNEFAKIFGEVMEWNTNPLAHSLFQCINLLNLPENTLIVEVGCGAGGGSQACLNALQLYNSGNVQFKAFDLSPQMVEIAKQKLANLNFSNVSVSVASAECLPLENGE